MSPSVVAASTTAATGMSAGKTDSSLAMSQLQLSTKPATVSPAAAAPAVFKPCFDGIANREKDFAEGLEGLALQWGGLSLKPDVEGGSFACQSNPTDASGLKAPPEFFLLGTVRAVENFSPRAIEKAMIGAWSPSKEMEMTVMELVLVVGSFMDKFGDPNLLVGGRSQILGTLQLGLVRSCIWSCNPSQSSYKAPIVCSAARQGSTNDGKSKRRTTKGLRNGDQGMKKADEPVSTSKRRRGEESSSHNNDSTELK